MGIHIYFGAPGSGKTSHAAYVARRYLSRGVTVFCNVPIVGCRLISVTEDIGVYDISDGVLIIDEAGIDFNSRKTLSLPQHVIKWLKKYRHSRISDIYLYSQAPDDMDITLRRLATDLYDLRRTLIPGICATRRIFCEPGIDDMTKQLTTIYSYVPLSLRLHPVFTAWKYFDSWSVDPLPHRDFPVCGSVADCR